MNPRAIVIISSTRAATGVYADTTGPLIDEWFQSHGFDTAVPVVVPDGEPFTEALRTAIEQGVDLIVTSGGTGIAPTDQTAERTRALLTYEIPGIAEEVRRVGAAKIATAVLSRGVAGVVGRTLVVNLPGSRGGVQDGLTVLGGVVDHALDQLAGGDHPRTDG